jgi:hypothetical protein
MDLSPFVAWSVPLVGVLFAVRFGMSRAVAGGTSIWGSALLVAFGLGFLLVLPQVALHSMCVEAKFCTNRGDVNMSYWFQSFLAIPLYWLSAGLVWHLKK